MHCEVIDENRTDEVNHYMSSSWTENNKTVFWVVLGIILTFLAFLVSTLWVVSVKLRASWSARNSMVALQGFKTQTASVKVLPAWTTTQFEHRTFKVDQ